jgi:acetyl-CoA carboxylase biotin carboxyl carrier protein
MDLRKIKKLIELVEESGITEIEVKSGEEAVRIVRPDGSQTVTQAVTTPVSTSGQALPPQAAVGSAQTVTAVNMDAACIVTAPLTGTFYRAPTPGEPPYVSTGQKVNVGDVLCIIESMKMMNHIEAEQAGTVTSVLVDDGVPVQEEQALFTIE